jgi:hypothetical protein
MAYHFEKFSSYYSIFGYFLMSPFILMPPKKSQVRADWMVLWSLNFFLSLYEKLVEKKKLKLNSLNLKFMRGGGVNLDFLSYSYIISKKFLLSSFVFLLFL